MADVAIIAPEVAAAPQDYTLPGAQEIILKAVGCQINGAGAAGSFLPALQMLDPAGHVMWTAVNRSLPVAAGGSALVSWFPGGGIDTAGSSTSGGITSLKSAQGTLTVGSPNGPATTVDMPKSGVTAGSYGDASDSASITVDAEGRITAATSVPISGGGTVVASDGWVPDTTETWTYASGAGGVTGTFTTPGDLRAKYTVGTRVKFIQTTTRYFVVSADPTYDGTNTTVTITGGSDYSIANAAISGNYHSYVVNPQGYPGWFNWTAAATGYSAKTRENARFSVVGRAVSFFYDVDGTSNATTLTITAPPLTPAAAAQLPVYTSDSSGDSGTPQVMGSWLWSSATVITTRKQQTSAGYTASGEKWVTITHTYQV